MNGLTAAEVAELDQGVARLRDVVDGLVHVYRCDRFKAEGRDAPDPELDALIALTVFLRGREFPDACLATTLAVAVRTVSDMRELAG